MSSTTQQLTGMDYMFFGFEDDNNPIHIAGVSICDSGGSSSGKSDGKKIAKLVRDRLESLPMVRRRLRRVPLNLDYPYWAEDEGFDLDYHVRSVELESPGTWKQLMDKSTRLLNKPFDPSRPLWELYFIGGLDDAPDLAPGSFALVLKMHHAFADASTAMVINDVMFDESSHSEDVQEGFLPTPDALHLLGTAARNLVGRTLESSVGALRAAPQVARFVAHTISRSVRDRPSVLDSLAPPRSVLNPKRLNPERLADARRFDFRGVRRIRELVEGATINDVLLAIVGGGIRRYLKRRDAEHADTLTSVVPIDLRQFDVDASGSNIVSAMLLPLHQEIEDPIDRLSEIHAASSRSKRQPAMDLNRRVAGVVTGLPAPTLGVALAAIRKVAYTGNRVFASTIVSNARSFSEVRYVAGHEVKYMFGIGMLAPGIGSLHACTVYADHLNIGLTCSPDAIPETGEYMGCLEASFAEYVELASGGR